MTEFNDPRECHRCSIDARLFSMEISAEIHLPMGYECPKDKLVVLDPLTVYIRQKKTDFF